MTFLSKDITHARLLYDQLAIISPLFISLSAGSAIYKGKLAEWDSKWDCLSMSVDDRTKVELNKDSPFYIPKSKYSSISSYISNSPMNLPEYNDIYFPKNEEIMEFARYLSM
jgi:glutamate--cysteine ligase catalytic subunit